MSEDVVNKFADQPWCAAVARLIRPTTAHSEWNKLAVAIGATRHAQVSIAVSRAGFSAMPNRR